MKYIIEIENTPFGNPERDLKLYKCTQFKSLVFDEEGLSKLTPYTEPDLNITKDNPVHLCESCNRMQSLVSCPSKDEDSLFGEDGKSICCCKYYVPETTDRKAIEDAQEEAWSLAKKIALTVPSGGLTINEIKDCYGSDKDFADDVFKDFSYQEAKTKYDDWKAKRGQIHVGDEVKPTNLSADSVYNEPWVVTMIDVRGGLWGIGEKVHGHHLGKDDVVKTGRSFPEVAELLKKIKENP